MRAPLPLPIAVTAILALASCARERPTMLHETQSFAGDVHVETAGHVLQGSLAFDRATKVLQFTWRDEAGALTLKRLPSGLQAFYDGHPSPSPPRARRAAFEALEQVLQPPQGTQAEVVDASSYRLVGPLQATVRIERTARPHG